MPAPSSSPRLCLQLVLGERSGTVAVSSTAQPAACGSTSRSTPTCRCVDQLQAPGGVGGVPGQRTRDVEGAAAEHRQVDRAS